MVLKAGDSVPDFELLSGRGETVRLSDFRGRKVVLFWYATAGSPSCTTEACGFRDDYSGFEEAGAAVLGISPDKLEDQRTFSEQHGFPYPLLADPDLEAAKRFEVWGPKKMFGREVMGILRTTFIIDEEGVIRKVFERVRTPGHSRKVLEALRAL